MAGTQGQSFAVSQRDRQVIARATPRIPLVIAGGLGATIVDADGRKLLDLTSGWNVVNTGWNHPRVVEAVRLQASAIPFAPPWCSHAGRVDVAERLSEYLGGGWSVLCGATGSEAIEAALKVARRATGRKAIVGFTNAYHGGTLGAMLAGGVPQLHGIDLPPDNVHRQAPIPDAVRRDGRDYAVLARETILSDPLPAAVLIEPLFSNPGVIHGDDAFYRGVADATREAGALLIVDEVGTGFGRTGKLFLFEHWALRPDIVVVAKALTSGAVPMAGALLRTGLASAVSGPGFSSTFGWTPLACAAAQATLDVLRDEDLVERSEDLGRIALSRLSMLTESCPHVAAVRGLGLEIGVEIVDSQGNPVSRPIMEVLIQALLKRDIFAEPSAYTSTLLIMPPLVISETDLNQAVLAICEEVNAFNPDGNLA